MAEGPAAPENGAQPLPSLLDEARNYVTRRDVVPIEPPSRFWARRASRSFQRA
jgi:hypothetical protein